MSPEKNQTSGYSTIANLKCFFPSFVVVADLHVQEHVSVASALTTSAVSQSIGETTALALVSRPPMHMPIQPTSSNEPLPVIATKPSPSPTGPAQTSSNKRPNPSISSDLLAALASNICITTGAFTSR